MQGLKPTLFATGDDRKLILPNSVVVYKVGYPFLLAEVVFEWDDKLVIAFFFVNFTRAHA